MTALYGNRSVLRLSTHPGIYHIVHRATDRLYVGSAVNFRARVQLHLKRLRAGIHHNAKLQAAWKTYGEEAFDFVLIEEVPDRSLLKAREQFYMDTLKPHYNIALHATAPMLGRKQSAKFLAVQAARVYTSPSPAMRAQISAALTGRKNGPVPLERRQRIAAALKGHPARSGEDSPSAKLTWDKVRAIRQRYALGETTQRQLAQEYGVDATTISLVIREKRWKGTTPCSE